MRILFIYPDLNYVAKFMPDYEGSTSIGLAYLSANLKKHGHRVSVFHITKEITKGEYISRLRNYDFDLVGFTAFSNQNQLIRKYAKWTKEFSNVLTVYGGVHPTVDPENAISLDGIDMICLGEGEDAVVELCDTLQRGADHSNIQSFWVKKVNEIVKNPIRPLRQDLDSLPFPDLSIFDIKTTVQFKLKSLEVLTTRGCSYSCTYCCNHQYRKLYESSAKYVRFRSPDNVIEEIVWQKSQRPELDHVVILDDTLGLNKELLLEFCEKYKLTINMPWRTNTHAQVIDEDTIKAMKDSGCKRISIGIESGDMELRKIVLNRKLDNETIKKAFRLCQANNIEVMTYNMVGVPFETRETALKTIKLNAELKTNPRLIHVAILQPYPKTAIYDLCVKNKFIDSGSVPDTYFSTSILEQPSITRKEVEFAFEYFYIFLKVYQIIARMPKTLSNRLESYTDKMFINHSPEKMLKLKPLFYILLFPVQATKRTMLRFFPHLSRALKHRFLKAKFRLG